MSETLHLPDTNPKRFKIHTLIPEDVECEIKVSRMVEYGKQFWCQTRYFAAGVGYDVETVTNMTHHLLDEGVVLYAEDRKGKIIALMLVMITPSTMNRHYLIACEWVFYVDPAYRRSGLGAKLISQAEKILREQRVQFFTMVSLTNVTPKAANKLYETLGFEESEINFTKEL